MTDLYEKHQTWGYSFELPKQYKYSTNYGLLALFLQYGNWYPHCLLGCFHHFFCWYDNTVDIIVANKISIIFDARNVSVYPCNQEEYIDTYQVWIYGQTDIQEIRWPKWTHLPIRCSIRQPPGNLTTSPHYME